MKFQKHKWLLVPLFIAGLTTAFLASDKRERFFETEENEEMEEAEERERETGADKQMEMLWQARAYPDHQFLNDKYMAAWQQAKAMQNPEQISGAAGTSGSEGMNYGAWTAAGNLQVGRVLAIAINPTTPTTVFIGSASGGIWKTTNSGTSWTSVTTGFPVLGVAAITYHPTDPNILLAGTGEVYRADTSNIGYNVWKARGTYGVGILRSANGGTTWTQVMTKSFSNLFGVQMIKFDPNNSNIVYACTTNGLYKSTDAGVTWGGSPILNKIYVSDVVINSTNSNQMMAAVGNLVNSDKGIYRSTDGGATWAKVVSAAVPTNSGGFSRFAYLSGNTVYISMGMNDANENELIKSTNFGSTWSTQATSHHTQYQTWFSHVAAIIPSRPDSLLMGGVSFYRYRSSTATRSAIGSMYSDFHDIKFDPSNSSIAYIACDGGMYRTANATAASPTFTQINSGLNIAQFYASIGVSRTTANLFIGGLQDNGVWSYNGTTWTNRLGGDGGPCMIDPNNNSIVYASNDARRLNKSTGGVGGAYGTALGSWAFTGDDRVGFMAPIAMSKASSTTIYSASDNLHKSTNSGSTWTNNNGTISANTNYIAKQFNTGIALAVSETNASKLYVSTSPFSQRVDNALNVVDSPQLFKSTDGGATFVNISPGLPKRFVLDISISPTNDDSIVVVLGGYGSSHVYVSGNGGGTWVNRGVGLPDAPYNAVVSDPTNANYMYVGGDMGVYVSNNKGVTWYSYNGGFTDGTMVFDLQITADNKLLAATHGKGAYLSALATYSTLPSASFEFSGQNRNDRNELKWVATNEKDVAQYEIEKSVDGLAYSFVASVAAKNLISASYSYNDPVPSSVSQAVYYYRLKKVDKNGAITYSNVVAIKYYKSATMQVLGNPITKNSSLRLSVGSPQNITINLFDLKASLLMSQKSTVSAGINYVSLENLPVLASGTYVLEAVLQNEKIRKKVSH